LAISVEVDTDFVTAREARTTDDPIDATSTAKAVDDGSVNVRDSHYSHGWIVTTFNMVV
jgi:hypothetical protein